MAGAVLPCLTVLAGAFLGKVKPLQHGLARYPAPMTPSASNASISPAA